MSFFFLFLVRNSLPSPFRFTSGVKKAALMHKDVKEMHVLTRQEILLASYETLKRSIFVILHVYLSTTLPFYVQCTEFTKKAPTTPIQNQTRPINIH